MKTKLLIIFTAATVLAVTAKVHAGEPEERMRLQDCVRIALEQSQESERALAKIDEAAAARKMARGRFGPILQAEAGIQRWDAPTEIEFSIPGAPVSPALEAQKATTMQLSFTAVQPVTSLWAIYEGYQAASLGEQAARVEARTANQDIEQKVADAYFQALTAERFVGIAGLAVGLIDAHVKRAKVLHEHQLIARNKILEAEVRLAQAKADLIKARGGMRLARSNLAFQMGLPVDREIAPEVIKLRDVPTRAPDAEGEREVGKERPEVTAARLRIRQAEAGVSAARAMMLPQVNLIASAQYAKGSEFQKEAAYFVGAQATWVFWEWGSTYYGIDQAKARVRQARSGVTQLTEGTRLELKKAKTELETARDKLDVMRFTVGQAEENLRIVQKTFELDAGTSTDVLDAQMLLAKAKADEAMAYHEYLQARVAQRRARGLKPTEATLGE